MLVAWVFLYASIQNQGSADALPFEFEMGRTKKFLFLYIIGSCGTFWINISVVSIKSCERAAGRSVKRVVAVYLDPAGYELLLIRSSSE